MRLLFTERWWWWRGWWLLQPRRRRHGSAAFLTISDHLPCKDSDKVVVGTTHRVAEEVEEEATTRRVVVEAQNRTFMRFHYQAWLEEMSYVCAACCICSKDHALHPEVATTDRVVAVAAVSSTSLCSGNLSVKQTFATHVQEDTMRKVAMEEVEDGCICFSSLKKLKATDQSNQCRILWRQRWWRPNRPMQSFSMYICNLIIWFLAVYRRISAHISHEIIILLRGIDFMQCCLGVFGNLGEGFGGRQQDRPPTSKGWTKGGGGWWVKRTSWNKVLEIVWESTMCCLWLVEKPVASWDSTGLKCRCHKHEQCLWLCHLPQFVNPFPAIGWVKSNAACVVKSRGIL